MDWEWMQDTDFKDIDISIIESMTINPKVHGIGICSGTVTKIDNEGFRHISVDEDPGRAKIGTVGDNIEYHNNFAVEEYERNVANVSRLSSILKVIKEEDIIHHHPQAINSKCLKVYRWRFNDESL